MDFHSSSNSKCEHQCSINYGFVKLQKMSLLAVVSSLRGFCISAAVSLICAADRLWPSRSSAGVACGCSGDSWAGKQPGVTGSHYWEPALAQLQQTLGKGCHLQSESPYSSGWENCNEEFAPRKMGGEAGARCKKRVRCGA